MSGQQRAHDTGRKGTQDNPNGVSRLELGTGFTAHTQEWNSTMWARVVQYKTVGREISSRLSVMDATLTTAWSTEASSRTTVPDRRTRTSPALVLRVASSLLRF
jgi:hypothetical protein